MIAAGYTRSSTACMVCLTFAVGLGGFAWGGFSVNHLDIAPQVSRSDFLFRFKSSKSLA